MLSLWVLRHTSFSLVMIELPHLLDPLYLCHHRTIQERRATFRAEKERREREAREAAVSAASNEDAEAPTTKDEEASEAGASNTTASVNVGNADETQVATAVETPESSLEQDDHKKDEHPVPTNDAVEVNHGAEETANLLNNGAGGMNDQENATPELNEDAAEQDSDTEVDTDIMSMQEVLSPFGQDFIAPSEEQEDFPSFTSESDAESPSPAKSRCVSFELLVWWEGRTTCV